MSPMRHKPWRSALLAGLVLLASPAAGTDVEDDPAIQRLRIMGGSLVGLGEFPSLVSLQSRGPNEGTAAAHRCGGTVIGREWVLTAAHCVVSHRDGRAERVPAARLVIAEGREDHRQLRRELLRLVAVREIIVHPGYDLLLARLPDGNSTVIAAPYDAALLRLGAPSERPRQLLAAAADRAALERPGNGATVAGFGARTDGGPPSEALLRTSLPIVPIDRCIGPQRRALQGIERLIGPTQLCAGHRGGSTDSCEGDSGGPLFVQARGGQVAQIGIVSLGPPCRVPVAGYGTYASVAAIADWIRHHVPDADFTQAERRDSAPAPAAAATVPPATAAANQPAATPPQVPAPAVPQVPAAAAPTVPAPTARPDERLGGAAETPPGVAPGQVGQVSIDIREGNRLPVGSRASFRITSSVGGVLFVVARDPAGTLVQLFPNERVAGFLAGQTSPYINPGQMVVLPGPADGFRAEVRPPLGEAVVIAVVLPRSAQAESLARRHTQLRAIPEPAAFLAELQGLAEAARGMTPEALPSNLAIGFRRFQVVPPS
jgi:secreted trypsin-like serine protease